MKPRRASSSSVPPRPINLPPSLLQLLLARLSVPLLSSLLIPVLPLERHNLIFQIYPFYASLRALLQRPTHGTGDQSRKHNPAITSAGLSARQTQWLAYWCLYATVKAMEQLRVDLTTPSRVWSWWKGWPTRKALESNRKAQILGAMGGQTKAVMTPTVAAQIAGTRIRWRVIKCILLFYAMDEELQGARWILEKIIKPIAGFFQTLPAPLQEEVPEADGDSEEVSPIRELFDVPEEESVMPDLSNDGTSSESSPSTISSIGQVAWVQTARRGRKVPSEAGEEEGWRPSIRYRSSHTPGGSDGDHGQQHVDSHHVVWQS